MVEVPATLIESLRALLKRMRWDDQGGYPSYLGDGKWSFVSTSIGQVSPALLNDLFALVGIEPDVIEPIGTCADCVFAVDGSERGYASPCLECKRPRMSNFVGITRARRKAVCAVDNAANIPGPRMRELCKRFQAGEGSTKAVP